MPRAPSNGNVKKRRLNDTTAETETSQPVKEELRRELHDLRKQVTTLQESEAALRKQLLGHRRVDAALRGVQEKVAEYAELVKKQTEAHKTLSAALQHVETTHRECLDKLVDIIGVDKPMSDEQATPPQTFKLEPEEVAEDSPPCSEAGSSIPPEESEDQDVPLRKKRLRFSDASNQTKYYRLKQFEKTLVNLCGIEDLEKDEDESRKAVEEFLQRFVDLRNLNVASTKKTYSVLTAVHHHLKREQGTAARPLPVTISSEKQKTITPPTIKVSTTQKPKNPRMLFSSLDDRQRQHMSLVIRERDSRQPPIPRLLDPGVPFSVSFRP